MDMVTTERSPFSKGSANLQTQPDGITFVAKPSPIPIHLTARKEWFESQQTPRNTWPVLSLFSGAGGFDLGFGLAGFRPCLAIDFDLSAVETYRSNHPGTHVVQLDLLKTEPDELVSLWKNKIGPQGPVGIIGGPPCQGFSVSNVHQKKGDSRRRLLQRYAYIVETFESNFGLDFFAFENVPGLIGKQHLRRYKLFKHRCEKAGFNVCEDVIDAGNFGIPQHRTRLIVIGVNKKRFPNVDLKVPTGDREPLPTRSALEGLPEPTFPGKGLEAVLIPFHPNHIAMVPKSPKFSNGKLEPGDCRGRSFRVLQWDSPSYTVAYGHREVHIHPNLHRRLSVFEAMLLQGFPNWYELKGTLSQQIELVSNAVPPPLGTSVATTIAKALNYNQELAKQDSAGT